MIKIGIIMLFGIIALLIIAMMIITIKSLCIFKDENNTIEDDSLSFKYLNEKL